MENLNIREAKGSDLPAIMDLIGQSDMSPDNSLSQEEIFRLFESINKTGIHKIYVALHGTNVIGTFALVLVQSLTHNGGRSVILEDVVVKSSFQGQGIGREMMEFAAGIAQQLGGTKLILSSGKARTQAHEFYEHLGYTIDGYRFALTVKG